MRRFIKRLFHRHIDTITIWGEMLLGLFFIGLFIWLLFATHRGDSKEISTIKTDCLSMQQQIKDIQRHIEGLEKTMGRHWKVVNNKLKEKM